MKLYQTLVFSFLLLLLSACEKQADLKQTHTYSKDGLSFTYPGNWQVTEAASQDDIRAVIIETAGDAIATINTYSVEDKMVFSDYVTNMIDYSIEELPFGSRAKGTVEKFNTVIAEEKYQGYKNTFDIKLAGFKVPHIAEFYEKRSDKFSSFIITQVATEDAQKVKKGFELIISTYRY